MIKTTIVCASLLALSGCITSAHLTSADGKRYPMEISQSARTLSADIDGVKYAGIYAPTGSSEAITTGMVGTRPIMAVSAGGGNSGRAMLQGANGDLINCEFIYSGTRAMGQCKGRNGRDYTLTTE